MHIRRERDGEAKDRGTPRVIASRAAREKLRTDVTEMSVLARHILMAFKRAERGAALADADDGWRANRQSDKVAHHTGGRIYASRVVSSHGSQIITTKIDKPTKCEVTTTMKAPRSSRRRVTHFFF